MDFVYYSNVSTFANAGGLDDSFMEVCSSSVWGILSPYENKRVCDRYVTYTIPFYECVFSFMGFRLSFTAFVMQIHKYLVMDPS